MNDNYNFNGKNILVVDDDKASVHMAESCLQRAGADVLSASNGSDAVKLVSDRHIDLILMNIDMPIMDGYEATSKIRKINKKVPIIAYTTSHLNGEKERCLQSGFNDYLLKPVYPDVILSTIDKYLE